MSVPPDVSEESPRVSYPAAELFEKARREGRVKDVRTLIAGARREFRSGTALCLPVYRGIEADTFESLWRGRTALEKFTGQGWGLIQTKSSCPSANRETAARGAVWGHVQFAIWVDSDQVFDSNSLINLLVHARELYGDPENVEHADVTHTLWMLCGVYPRRSPEPQLACAFLPSMRQSAHGEPPWQTIQEAAAKGFIAEVETAGMGFCIIPGAALALMGDNRFQDPLPGPWMQGEDAYFAQRLRDLGGTVYADFSLRVGHIIESTYDLSWYVRSRMLAEGEVQEIPVTVKLRKPPIEEPHQRGGVIYPPDESGKGGAA